jgi:superfamily II DNA or RNA helicase
MRIRFDRGTLVLEAEQAGEDPEQIPGAVWDPAVHAWRVPAARHRTLLVRYPAGQVRQPDNSRTPELTDDWALPELRWYQARALTEWRESGHRGVIALPAGAGKTLVAIAAIAELGDAALVLVPTRLHLDRWVRALAASWPHPIGRLGDGAPHIAPITIATYASAGEWAPRIGDRFGLVIVDEVHHVGAWCPAEVLEMLVAPARLGLTAALPSDADALVEHVGHPVYELSPDDLARGAPASHDRAIVPIPLTRAERVRYRELRGRFDAIHGDVARSLGALGWNDFVRAAAQYEDGRRALAAWRGCRALVAYPDGMREALRRLLVRHRGARTLVLAPDTATTYAIARELLVAPLTRELGRAELARTADRFRRGEVPALVVPQAADTSLDVPDADAAILVGGSAGAPRLPGWLGRVLRPRDGARPMVHDLVVEEARELDHAKRRPATAPPRAMEAAASLLVARALRLAPPPPRRRWRLPAPPQLPAGTPAPALPLLAGVALLGGAP